MLHKISLSRSRTFLPGSIEMTICENKYNNRSAFAFPQKCQQISFGRKRAERWWTVRLQGIGSFCMRRAARVRAK